MQLFLSSTPYLSPRLLRCLRSLSPSPCSTCFFPPYIVTQSRRHSDSSNSSDRNNPSGHGESAPSENSYKGGESRVGSDGSRSSSSISISPIGRIDISDETTYMPQKPAGGSDITIKKQRGFLNKNGMRTPGGQHIIERNSLAQQHGPKKESLSVWAKIVVLTGVGTTLLESDIRRLVPGKAHIPEFKSEFDILRVSPYRFPKSLKRRPFYSLVFNSPEAAKMFVYGQGDFWLSSTNSTIPPGQTPRLYYPREHSKHFYDSNRSLSLILSRGGCSPGACVLLVISDIGGTTTETGKLPRTAEVREMLESTNVQFCKRDEVDGGAGLERVLFEKTLGDGTKVVDKFDGSEMGAEGKWIVRCRDAAEAHRVVRDWHRKEFREGGGKFSAEIIY